MLRTLYHITTKEKAKFALMEGLMPTLSELDYMNGITTPYIAAYKDCHLCYPLLLAGEDAVVLAIKCNTQRPMASMPCMQFQSYIEYQIHKHIPPSQLSIYEPACDPLWYALEELAKADLVKDCIRDLDYLCRDWGFILSYHDGLPRDPQTMQFRMYILLRKLEKAAPIFAACHKDGNLTNLITAARDDSTCAMTDRYQYPDRNGKITLVWELLDAPLTGLHTCTAERKRMAQWIRKNLADCLEPTAFTEY